MGASIAGSGATGEGPTCGASATGASPNNNSRILGIRSFSGFRDGGFLSFEVHLGKRLIHGVGGQGRSFRFVRNPGGISHAGSRFHTILVYNRPGLRHFRFKGADQRLVRLFADGLAKALGGSLFFRAIRNRLLRQRGSLALRRQQRHEGRLFESLQENHHCSQKDTVTPPVRTLPRAGFPDRPLRAAPAGLARHHHEEPRGAPVQETPRGHRRYQKGL